LTSVNSEVELDVDLSKIGVVIPAYNAEKTIADVIGELVRYGFRKRNIIAVNDGSKDRTEDVIRSLNVHMLKHERNIGKGAALRDGFAAARQMNLKKVIVIDADSQHRVSDVDAFLKVNGRYDITIGERTNILANMPLDRMLTNRIVNLVVSLLSDVRTTDVQCGFRYVDLKIFDNVCLKTNNYQTESELFIKAARRRYKIGFVPVSTIYAGEKSHINPLLDTWRFINMAVRLLWR